jgi:hypothetical protein
MRRLADVGLAAAAVKYREPGPVGLCAPAQEVTGYWRGNFYVCGPGVRFEGPGPHATHPVSIHYPSLDVTPLDSTDDHRLDFVTEARRLDMPPPPAF